MFEQCGIDTAGRRIVNHSGRVTCCTPLYNEGFEEQTISGRSGHRSAAVRLYKRPSTEMEKSVSRALDVVSEDSKPYSNGNTGVKTEQNVVDKSVLQSASRSIRIELPDGIDTVIVCKNGRETSMTVIISYYS